MLGLNEPVHGQYWKVQATVQATKHRLKKYSPYKDDKSEILNLETSADVHRTFNVTIKLHSMKGSIWFRSTKKREA
jgi:hypothetical protein